MTPLERKLHAALRSEDPQLLLGAIGVLLVGPPELPDLTPIEESDFPLGLGTH